MTVFEAEAEVVEKERQALEAVNEVHAHLQSASESLKRLVGAQHSDKERKAARALLNRLESVMVDRPGTLTERLMRARVQALKSRAMIAEAALAAHALAMRELREVSLMRMQLEAELGAQPFPPQPPVQADEAVWDEETRHGPRVPMQCAIDYASEAGFFTAFTTNVSDGGLFIATAHELPVGTKLGLAFTLPTGQIIQAEGEVRWVRPFDDGSPSLYPGLGVRFTQVSHSDASMLQTFIASREETLAKTSPHC